MTYRMDGMVVLALVDFTCFVWGAEARKDGRTKRSGFPIRPGRQNRKYPVLRVQRTLLYMG